MKQKAKQKLLTLLIIPILLCVLIISCFCVFVIQSLKKKNEQISDNLEVYAFTSSTISESDYNKYDVFEINSAEGFLTFQQSMKIVKEGVVSTSAVSNAGYSYAGKTVVQKENIVVPLAGITYPYEFAGVYDGEGKSITYSSTATYDDNSYIGAFCTYLAGTVKNTRFINGSVQINENSGWFGAVKAGIIAGWVQSDGKIESCIVENCKFISKVDQDNCFVAPIAGNNNGTVKNCMVVGSYKFGAIDKKDGLHAYYFTAQGNNAQNSIYAATWSKITNDDNDGLYCLSPNHESTDNGSVDARDAYNYSSCSSAYTLMPNHDTYKSYISKSLGPEGSVWFQYNSSSKGYGKSSTYCVYLRAFVGWTPCTFTAGTGGFVSKTTIQVPSDYSTISTSGNTATVYGETVTANPSTGYEFSHWSGSGSSRTANFKKLPLKISFKDVTNCTESSSTISLGSSYYIIYEDSITLTYTRNSNNTIKAIKFSFTDSGGTPRSITYTAAQAYYISANSLTTGNSYKVTDTQTDINVTVALKSYNINLG